LKESGVKERKLVKRMFDYGKHGHAYTLYFRMFQLLNTKNTLWIIEFEMDNFI